MEESQDPDISENSETQPSKPPAQPAVRELREEDLEKLRSRLGPEVLEQLKEQFRGEWLHVRDTPSDNE